MVQLLVGKLVVFLQQTLWFLCYCQSIGGVLPVVPLLSSNSQQITSRKLGNEEEREKEVLFQWLNVSVSTNER